MIRAALLVVWGFSVALFLPSCFEREAHAEASIDEAAEQGDENGVKVVNVVVEKVVPDTVTEYVTANGITQAAKETTYSSEIGGRIVRMSAELGEEVKRGQVLARIDVAAIGAQARQAKASYELANSTYDRISSLKGEELISQQQFEEASANKAGSSAQLAAARANLSKSTVKSSHAGIVSAKYMDVSEYAGPGSRLYTVVDFSSIIIEARLAETQVIGVVSGAEVQVKIAALDETFTGTVETLIPTADKVSKTFVVRVKVDNPDRKILVGMSTRINIKTTVHENAVVVTQSAIVEERKGQSIFVAEDGRAVKRPVVTGAIEGDRVVVVEGLNIGEDLIVTGQRDLANDQPVKVVQ